MLYTSDVVLFSSSLQVIHYRDLIEGQGWGSGEDLSLSDDTRLSVGYEVVRFVRVVNSIDSCCWEIHMLLYLNTTNASK